MTRGSTRTTARATTRTLAAVTAAVLALAVAGCSNHLDAGSGAGDDFAEHFRSVEGIASVDGGGTNDLPFSGKASVDAELEPGLSGARVTALVDDMGRYMAEHANGSLSWSGRVVVDGYRIPLAAKKTPNHRVLRALESVRHDERFEGGTIARSGVALGAADPDDLAAAWDRARRVAAAVPHLSPGTTIAYAGRPDDDDDDFSPWSSAAWVVSSSDREARDFPDVARPPSDSSTSTPTPTPGTAPPLDATDLGSLVRDVAAVPGTDGAVVTPSTVSVHTETAAQATGVRTAVAALLPTGVQLLVSGGDVHRSGAGEYAAPDRIVAAVAATGVHTTRVEETPTSVGFVVSDTAAARAVASAVGAVADPAAVERIEIASSEDALGADRQPETGFAVSADPSTIVRAAAVVTAVAPWTPAAVLLPSASDRATELWLSVPSTSTFPALTRAVRPLGLDGASVQVRLASGSVLNVTVHDELDVSDAGTDAAARRAADELRTAWRDAG